MYFFHDLPKCVSKTRLLRSHFMASVKSKLQHQASKSQNVSNMKTDLANLACE